MNDSKLPARVGTYPSPVSMAPAATETSDARAHPLTQAEPSLTLLEVMLRHKARLIGCVIVALGLGVVYQLNAPRKYESTAEIFVQTTRDGQPASPLASAGVSTAQPSTHASLMKSTPVLRAALSNPDVAASQALAAVSDPLGHLRKNLKVAFAQERETLTVSLRTGVPEESALIVNAVIDAYLQTQQSEVRVVESGDLAADAAAAGPRGVMDDKLIAAKLTRISEELTQAEEAFHAADMRCRDAEAASSNVTRLAALLAQSGKDGRDYGFTQLALLRAELGRTVQQLDAMPPTWGPTHQVRARVQRYAESLREEIELVHADAARVMLSLLTADREQAGERVAELRARMDAEQARAALALQLPVMVIERAQVPLRKVAPKGVQTMGIALFLGLAAGVSWMLYRELNNPAIASPGSAHAAVPAEVDAAFAADSDLALLHRDEDVNDALSGSATPMLGRVPEVPTGSRLVSPEFDATASSIHQIRAVLQAQAGAKGTQAFAFTSPRRGAGKTSVTIGVASSLAMSGTRTLVVDCDLSGRIARGQTSPPAPSPVSGSSKGTPGGGVRNGNGHSHAAPRPVQDAFGPLDAEGSSPENPSLDHIVLDRGFLDEADQRALASPHMDVKVGVTGMLDGGSLSECLVHATVDGLCLLPAINAHTRHIGKMSDAFIRRLIEEARGRFDLILFDTGPVPGSVEALLVTSQVDGVILVVPQGESRQNLSRTMSYLKVVDAKVTGTVFNRVDPLASSAGSPAARGHAHPATAAPATDHSAPAEARPASAADLAAFKGKRPPEEDDEDSAFVENDVPLGSGILAAAVFSDAGSGYASENWKLKETSEFAGSVDELFEPLDDDDNNQRA